MADEIERRVIYLEINATKAVDGSTAATRALAAIDQGASSAGSALGALESASNAAGGAIQKTAIDLATAAQSATNLNTAYRTTAGGVLELARAATSAASSAQAQAAGFARLAEQKAAQASLAETRTLMDSVARSTDALAHVYGSATVAATAFATAQSQAAGYGRLAEQNMINAASTKSRETMAAVDAITPDQIKAFYFDTGSVPAPASPSPVASGRTSLTAQQKLILGYQLNDIFTSVAGGMNPLMIAAQQGPQITQVFGGIGNTLAAIPKPLLIGGGAALGVGAAALGVSALKELNDALETQKRRLGDMLGDQRLSAQAYADIAKQATSAGESIQQVTAQYANFSRASVFVGATGKEVANLTSVVSQVGRLGGSTPEEQSAGSAALARALKESNVSASNLDAILESMPGLGRRIADGLGVSVTQLRLMADAGQITNRQVFDALLSQQQKVDAKFKEAGITVGGFFSAALRGAEDLAVSIYKSVTGIELVASKADAARRATVANPNRPTPATPRVIGNNGSTLSLEEMISFGEAGQTDASVLNDPRRLQTQFLDVQRAAKGAADEAVLAASKIVDKLDPLAADMRSLQQQTDTVTKGLDALQSGLAGLDASRAAQETDRLTKSLQALREQSDAAGGSYLQAIKAVQTRQEQDELGMTPGQRAYSAKVNQLAPAGSGISIDEAQTVVSAQQLQMLDDMIAKQSLELTTQTAITAAMRNGKKAADDAAVAMQVLGITFEQLGKVTPELQVKLDVLTETLGQIREQARAQASIDASKPLIADLDGIAAAMDNVTRGAFAMKRAEAEAKAAHDENGTGGLQMQVFEARQNLTDATMLVNLDQEIKLTDKLAAAAGNVAEQKRIQLDYDIKQAQLAAGPNAQAPIALALTTEAASKANREAKEGLADMQRQVDLAQQQLDIIRTGAPDMAAQLAMLAKKNDLVSKGADLSLQANQDQLTAAGTKARLDEQIQYAKDAADATKRTWQTAYDNIQSSAADTFYDIFNGAGFNAQSAADAMKKVFLRAFAEIAAAAIIRPLITPLFQLGQAAGFIPTGIIPSATGVSGESVAGGNSSSSGSGVFGSASGGMFSGGTGGGLGSIFNTGSASGGGWLARQFSAVGNFLSTPLYGGPSAAAFEGVMPGMTGAQAQSYFSGLSDGGGIFSGAGPTIGQGIGGLASIGSGIFNLARGGGSTSSMVSGIGQTIGGIVTMLPIPGAQIAGPLISLGASLLGGLFGDSGPKIPPQPALVYGAGQFRPTAAGGYSYTGDSLGSGSPMQSNAETIATDLTKAFRSAGLTVMPSALIGGNIASGTDHVLNGTQWQDRAYTQTGLILPGGGYEALTYNDSSRNVAQASEYLLAQTFRANVLRGGVSGAGEALKAGLDKINPATAKDLDNVITMGSAYDKLGKTINPAKDAIDKISASFDALKDYATQAGLSLDPINDELKKQSRRSAQDFIDAMVDPLAVSLRALGDEREQALESARYIRDNYKDIYVDMDKIATYYTDKEAKLRDDFYSGSVTSLQAMIDRLTYGDLANASPALQLSGAKAAYEAGLAKAQTGDVTAITDLSPLAADYARAQQLYSGSGPDYEAVRRQIMADLLDEKARLAPSPSTTGAAQPVSTADQANNATIARLSAMLLDLTRKVDTLTDAQTAFTAQARRLASSGAR
jgi:tape measure domain-containing protein